MPRRPARDPLADIELPPRIRGTMPNDPANPGSSTIVQNAIARINRQRQQMRTEGQGEGSSVAVLRVRRPGSIAAQAGSSSGSGLVQAFQNDTGRGPRPGQGRNQGAGVPDTADRTNQGNARAGVTGVGTGQKSTNDQVTGRHLSKGKSGPGVARPLMDALDEELQYAVYRPENDPDPMSRMQTLPYDPNGPAPEMVPQGNKPPTFNFDEEIAKIQRFFQSAPEYGLSRLIGEDGQLTTPPVQYLGGTVYYDENLKGYGVQSSSFDEYIFDAEGRLREDNPFGDMAQELMGRTFVLSDDGFYLDVATGQPPELAGFDPDELQNMLAGAIPGVHQVPGKEQRLAKLQEDLATEALAAQGIQDQQARAAIFGEIAAILSDMRAEAAAVAKDERALANAKELAADQLTLDQKLAKYNDDLLAKREETQRIWEEKETDIAHARETARWEQDFALRQGDLDLAKRRFEQDTMLGNAQFALTLFQSISQNPEMLYGLQSSGLIEQFQQIIPGLNLGAMFPTLAEGEQAVSQLAGADLPSLAELQQMPADVQTRVLTTIAITTGVKRETIVAEIQRRASGQGLAGGGNEQLQRIPG